MTQSAPVVFNFQSHPVRTVLRDGEPWFVATDVAEALGYRDAEVAARHLGAHQKGVHLIGVPGQKLTLINESGMYRLVLRSRKPEAVAFSDWVTGEVLPAIRKTGRYEMAQSTPALPPPAQPVVLSLPCPGRYLVVVDAEASAPIIRDAAQCSLVRADYVSAVQRDLYTLRRALMDMSKRLSLLQGEANPRVVEQPLSITLETPKKQPAPLQPAGDATETDGEEH